MENLIDDKNKIWKVGLYIRLSKEDGDKEESDSIRNQREILHNFINDSEEFAYTQEYIDDGYSGTNMKRPSFQRMLNDIHSGNINCIVVKDLSRFGRDHLETGLLIEREFDAMGIRFISVLDGYDSLKKGSPLEDLMIPLKNIFNEFYSKDLSRKIKKTFVTKQKAGEYIGGFACYGYQLDPADRHHLVVDEYAADIVRQVFTMYLSGMSMRKIADKLNADNILSPAEYKRRSGSTYKTGNQRLEKSFWNRCSISEMLHNQIYIGDLVQGKTESGIHKKKKRVSRDKYIIVKNTHDAIIDKDTFDMVQKLLACNVRNVRTDEHDAEAIFSGLIRCGDCGCSMTQYRQKNNVAYRCSQYSRGGNKICSSHYISQIKLSKIILEDLNIIIRSVKDLSAIVNAEKSKFNHRKSSLNIIDIDNNIDKKRKKKLQAYSDYQDGLLNKEDYKIFCTGIDNDIALLNQKKEFYIKEQETLNEFHNIPWIKKLIELQRVDVLDRDILYEMIDKIIVYDDRTIRIVYRFGDELERFKELYQQ